MNKIKHRVYQKRIQFSSNVILWTAIEKAETLIPAETINKLSVCRQTRLFYSHSVVDVRKYNEE